MNGWREAMISDQDRMYIDDTMRRMRECAGAGGTVEVMPLACAAVVGMVGDLRTSTTLAERDVQALRARCDALDAENRKLVGQVVSEELRALRAEARNGDPAFTSEVVQIAREFVAGKYKRNPKRGVAKMLAALASVGT